jgi:ABC-2 type transport system permease protein
MLASMFANKVPFLWATLPVVIIMLVEAFIVEYFDLSHGMILETLKGYFNFAFRNGVYHIDDVNSVGFLMTKALFSKIELGASLLGCGFVYIAYLLRVKRN